MTDNNINVMVYTIFTTVKNDPALTVGTGGGASGQQRGRGAVLGGGGGTRAMAARQR